MPKKEFIPATWNAAIISMIAIAAISNAEIFESISILHYVLYFVPPTFVVLWFLYPYCRIEEKSNRKFVLLMLASLIIPSLLSKDYDLQYIVFMWWGFLPFAFPVRLNQSFIISLFVVLALCQLGLSAEMGFAYKRLDVDSLSSGSAALTHTLPVTFGIILGSLIWMRQYKLVVLCIAMILIAGKRSILMASSFSFGMMMLGLLLFRSSKDKNNKVHLLLILPFTCCALAISLMLPTIYLHIANYFGFNINIMTSGRYEGQSIAYATLFNSDILSLLFGRGFGQVDEFAIKGFHGATTLIHNDYLRLLIDLGIIPSFLYVFCFIRLVGKGILGIFLVVFEEYCWLTENNLIFIMLPILFYISLSCAKQKSDEKNNSELKKLPPLHPALQKQPG